MLLVTFTNEQSVQCVVSINCNYLPTKNKNTNLVEFQTICESLGITVIMNRFCLASPPLTKTTSTSTASAESAVKPYQFPPGLSITPNDWFSILFKDFFLPSLVRSFTISQTQLCAQLPSTSGRAASAAANKSGLQIYKATKIPDLLKFMDSVSLAKLKQVQCDNIVVNLANGTLQNAVSNCIAVLTALVGSVAGTAGAAGADVKTPAALTTVSTTSPAPSVLSPASLAKYFNSESRKFETEPKLVEIISYRRFGPGRAYEFLCVFLLPNTSISKIWLKNSVLSINPQYADVLDKKYHWNNDIMSKKHLDDVEALEEHSDDDTDTADAGASVAASTASASATSQAANTTQKIRNIYCMKTGRKLITKA